MQVHRVGVTVAVVIAVAVLSPPVQLAASASADQGGPVVVVFETEKGAIEIEVDAARAPHDGRELSEVRRRTLLRRWHGEPVGSTG